ncbi:MAG: class I SAM-dependent methyltransferase [Nitrospirae bacterium]|nr:class I SAM-dependent methyltransferase [Nitrospirota bacterium]
MKNIVNEKPADTLAGRTLYITKFVSDEDIKDKHVLDVGCGFGWFLLNCINRGVKNIVGLEMGEDSLIVAKKYLNSERLSLNNGTATGLVFDNDSFDTVTAWDVIEHIPVRTEQAMFKEIYRVLKHNGVFYMSTPYRSFFCTILDPAWWLIGHRHYSQNELVSIAEDRGFKVEQFEIRGGWWDLLAMWNMYISKWVFRRKPFLISYFHKQSNKEYVKMGGFTQVFMKARAMKK